MEQVNTPFPCWSFFAEALALVYICWVRRVVRVVAKGMGGGRHPYTSPEDRRSLRGQSRPSTIYRFLVRLMWSFGSTGHLSATVVSVLRFLLGSVPPALHCANSGGLQPTLDIL